MGKIMRRKTTRRFTLYTLFLPLERGDTVRFLHIFLKFPLNVTILDAQT